MRPYPLYGGLISVQQTQIIDFFIYVFLSFGISINRLDLFEGNEIEKCIKAVEFKIILFTLVSSHLGQG